MVSSNTLTNDAIRTRSCAEMIKILSTANRRIVDEYEARKATRSVNGAIDRVCPLISRSP